MKNYNSETKSSSFSASSVHGDSYYNSEVHSEGGSGSNYERACESLRKEQNIKDFRNFLLLLSFVAAVFLVARYFQ